MAINSISINVADLADVLLLYDRIQVWKSATQNGTYLEITAEEPTSATINGTVAGGWAVSGQTLSISIDNQNSVPVVFTGTNPLNLTQVLAQINAVIPGSAVEVPTDTNKVRMQSLSVGTLSGLTLGGAAATTLGLSTVEVYGKSPRIHLTDPTEDYSFKDFNGLGSDWYKTKYSSTVTGTVSGFSNPSQSNPSAVLSSLYLATCIAYLTDGAGNPIVGRRVIFIPVSSTLIDLGGGVIYGNLPSVDKLVVYTDAIGLASIGLVIGQTFRVFIEGTTIQREFVVPNVSTFNLLTAIATAPDPFSIVQAPPMPIRES